MYMIMPVLSVPTVTAGDDLAAVIAPCLNELAWPDAGRSLWGGDIVIIAGKILAKAQGRYVKRPDLAEDSPERVAAGLLSYRAVPEKMALLAPENADEAAAEIRKGLAARFGGRPGVIITGTEIVDGKVFHGNRDFDAHDDMAERGVRDVALGSAGIDLANGRGEAIVDALAAIGGLAMNTTPDCPVAVIRGVDDVLTYED